MSLLFVSLTSTGAGKSKTPDEPPSVHWPKLLVEQALNSLIVAAITFFATLGATASIQWKPALMAFGMTFFVELRKYRKL